MLLKLSEYFSEKTNKLENCKVIKNNFTQINVFFDFKKDMRLEISRFLIDFDKIPNNVRIDSLYDLIRIMTCDIKKNNDIVVE